MKLADYLKKENLSQGKFAKIMGVPQPTVFNWVHGRIPHVDFLPKIFLVTRGEVTANDFYINYKEEENGTKG
jgi:predicted transcriptional regulator